MRSMTKRPINQYIDVMICFARYYLTSIHAKHEKQDIKTFLNENDTTMLVSIGASQKRETLPYDIWQIFDCLDYDEIDLIRKNTLQTL